MTINSVPERDQIALEDQRNKTLRPSVPWLEFFRSVFFALFGWKRSYTTTVNWATGNIVAGGQATQAATVRGARAKDAVLVTSGVQVAGLGVDGVVTANDTVTIRRFNYSTGAVNPAADDFRIVVLQQ